MKVILFFSFVFLTIIFSCKKIDSLPQKMTYIYDIDSTIKTFYFEKNSWWLYIDSLSNLKDSIYVLNTTTDSSFLSCGNCLNCCPDTTKYYRILTRTIDIDYYYPVLGSIYGYYLYGSTIRIGNNDFPFYMEGQPIFYSNDTSCYFQNGICCIKRIGFYPQMNVLNQTFYNVYHFKIDASQQIKPVFDFDTELYFAPHIGIIKKTEHDTINGDKVWLLKNYEVWQ